MDEDFEITESTDWKDTKVPSLEQLDFSLRCQICKEFLTAPLLTSCGHSFCSLCIRRTLLHEKHCPVCRIQQSEGNLRKNPALEDVVQAFVKSRKMIMELATKETEPVEQAREEDTNMVDEEVQTESLSGQEYEDVEAPRSRKRKRTYTTRSGRATTRAQPVLEVMDSDHDDEDDIFALDSQQAGLNSPREPSPSPPPPPPGMAQCPVCQKYMKPEEIQGSHIDQCLENIDNPPPSRHHRRQGPPPPSRPSTEPSTPKKNRALGRTATGATNNAGPNFFTSPSKSRLNFAPIALGNSASMNAPPERLPKLNYHTMKEKDLRKKMQELGLSTEGSKAVLQQRHAEYVMLVNANLDAKHPRSKRELLMDMRTWETLRLDMERNRKPNHNHNTTEAEKEREKEQLKVYSKENDEDFKRLIEDAKRRRQVKKAEEEKNTEKDEENKENPSSNSSNPASGSAPPPDSAPPPSSQAHSRPQFPMRRITNSLDTEMDTPFNPPPAPPQHPYFSKELRPQPVTPAAPPNQHSPYMTSFTSSQTFDPAPPPSSQNTSKYVPQHQQQQPQSHPPPQPRPQNLSHLPPHHPQSLPQFQSYPHLTLDQQQIIQETVAANTHMSPQEKQSFMHLLATTPTTLQRVVDFRKQFNRPIILTPSQPPPQPQQYAQQYTQTHKPQPRFVQYQPPQQQHAASPSQYPSSQPSPHHHPHHSPYENLQAQAAHPGSVPHQPPNSSAPSSLSRPANNP
ncbi:DNA repair protein rad18 [Ascobolus immersus RN42]|uniref:Postreplication repair E3 ubiquitin-protein ligase RAD18 n=1 Tax=Ascobolus immersus RN42 TaxID=1160509 RepID=A0A3N4I9Q0_ASCIM|nr:DNA repair protein rad18 [Ascobolus immersus RN42]